ncbi:MAG: hypothetical protein ACRCY8_14405 [Dermatophilaceae bacterium]
MEIIDYLRILRRRRLVLVLVPLLAVLVAVAWAVLTPRVHTAVATVNGTALVGTATSQFTGPQGVSQFAAAFAAAAKGPAVVNAVSDRTSVPVDDVVDGLVVSQVGESPSMRVVYESTERGSVEPVLSAVVRETLISLFQPRADQAARDRDSAVEQVAAANAEAKALADKQGAANPRDIYAALIGKISALEQQQAGLRANGDAVAAAALDAPLKAARTQAKGYGPIIAEYATIEAKQRAATEALAAAQDQSRLAAGQLAATSSDRVVFVSGVSSATVVGEAGSLVPSVLGAGIFAALVLVLVLELLARGHFQRRARADDAAAHHAEPEDAEPEADQRAADGLTGDDLAARDAIGPEGPEPSTVPTAVRPAAPAPSAEPSRPAPSAEPSRPAPSAEPTAPARQAPPAQPATSARPATPDDVVTPARQRSAEPDTETGADEPAGHHDREPVAAASRAASGPPAFVVRQKPGGASPTRPPGRG